MVTNLLIIDISHDSVVIAEFDRERCCPVYTEHYTVMEYRDTGAILAEHFGRTRHDTAETCCVICDALRSGEWIIPLHNPQMRFSENSLKLLSGSRQLFLLSTSEALAFSTLMPAEQHMLHLSGKDLIDVCGLRLTVELDNAVACNVLSSGTGKWKHRRVTDEPEALPYIPFLEDFIHHYGVRFLLSERGLTTLYDYFSIRNGKEAQGLMSADILTDHTRKDEEAYGLATEHYFALLQGFFSYLYSGLHNTGPGPVFVIHTSSPAGFKKFYRQHAPHSSAFSVYLIRNTTPRLYGAAAWYRQTLTR